MMPHQSLDLRNLHIIWLKRATGPDVAAPRRVGFTAWGRIIRFSHKRQKSKGLPSNKTIRGLETIVGPRT